MRSFPFAPLLLLPVLGRHPSGTHMCVLCICMAIPQGCCLPCLMLAVLARLSGQEAPLERLLVSISLVLRL